MIEQSGKYTVFSTNAGWMGLAFTDTGIFASVLPQKTRNVAKLQLLSKLPFKPQFSRNDFAAQESSLISYFHGEDVCFEWEIDWAWATPFQKKVLSCVSAISRGAYLTYGDVAHFIGMPKAARAVGRALASNRIPIIIPCHRVIRQNGELGGFTGAELEFKARLLCLEGAEIKANKKETRD